ncbi:MAG: N-acetyltransferase [Spirochaetaceae bacterium]|nr:N-acetyltransferase [Spirochaetaceae bacterium]
MKIRKTQLGDFDAVLGIYAQARGFMRKTGNPSQWGDTWPPQDLIHADIQQQKSYVCVKETKEKASGTTEEILAVFFLEVAEDPTYAEIYEGSWLEENRPYGVVHRIASLGQGAGGFCLEWALAECGNIRIDTHEANLPMRSLLKKLGYTYCGMIYTHDGTSRLAYQKYLPETTGF